MRVVVVGGGNKGKKLSEILSKEKNDVILIEKDEKRAEELAEALDALVLHGDATEKEILKDADLEKCDALVTMTSDDKTNLMVCEIAKSMEVKKVVTRINDSSNEEFFRKLGISFLVNTTTSAITEFKNALEKKGRQIVGFVCGGQAEIMELYVEAGSKIVKKTVETLLKEKIVVCSLQRKGKLVLPKKDATIKEKDIIVICIPVSCKKKVERMLKGG